MKQRANFLLRSRVLQCTSDEELEMYRQSWDTINRPAYANKKWSDQQQTALDLIDKGVSYDDEEAKRTSFRWLHVRGCPGSGKSAVLLEGAIRCAKKGLTVVIICPTGALVTALKLLLPEFDGVDRIHVDTIHGILKYTRAKDRAIASWSPPSAFRQYEVIFADESSQYDDREWLRLFQTIREQPHLPFTVVVADFQQLQPISGGGLCKRFCDGLTQQVELKTVYRTDDPQHLVFQNRIRETQVEKHVLEEYFEGRHWAGRSLQSCVAEGLALEEKSGSLLFTWLTCTNAGSHAVCQAALKLKGVTDKDLEDGWACDPTSKSSLRILARPGLVIRLTRNLDKQRGFVNGALAVVHESLDGNRIFTARLLGTGNFVLVHPMEEDGRRFLPCCYGYATTIRRAQGASLDMGCLWFDQHYRHAGRGYGYVGVSRFRSQAGCYLFGKLRRTDFLPVGPEKEDEVTQRGLQSESTDSDDEGLEYYGQHHADYDPFEALAAMREASVSAVSADVVMGDFADGYEPPAPNPLPCVMSELPAQCNADFMW